MADDSRRDPDLVHCKPFDSDLRVAFVGLNMHVWAAANGAINRAKQELAESPEEWSRRLGRELFDGLDA